jgi:hypothetical protein
LREAEHAALPPFVWFSAILAASVLSMPVRPQSDRDEAIGPTRLVWWAFCVLAVVFTACAWSGLSVKEVIDLARR